MELITVTHILLCSFSADSVRIQVGSGSLPVRQVGAYCYDVPFLPSVNTAVCKQ